MHTLNLFQDIEWKKEWFSNISPFPNRYWQSLDNRKKFLEEFATKFNIKNPQDWGRITTSQVCEAGGVSLLSMYHGSLFTCLQSVYKGTGNFLCNFLRHGVAKRMVF